MEGSSALSQHEIGWALEAITDCVVLVDEQFRITYVNQRTADLNSVSSQWYLGKLLWDAWPASAGTALERNYRHALLTVTPVEFVHRYSEEDVIDVWLSIRAFPKPDGLAIFFRDVSDEKFRENAETLARENAASAIVLEERKQRFRIELSDALRTVNTTEEIGYVACKLAAQYLRACRGTYAFVFPKERRVQIKTGWQSNVSNIDGSYSYEDIGEELLRELEKGLPFTISDTDQHPYTSHQQGPSYADLEIRSLIGIPLMKDGVLLAILAVHDCEPRNWEEHEIELLEEVAHRVWSAIERTIAQNEILRLNDRYRALAETSASVVFAATPSGELTEIPLLRGLALYDQQEGLGWGWLSAVHPDDRWNAIETWTYSIEHGTPYEVEFRLLMENDRYRWHQARGVKVLEASGTVREWIGTCVDVHERITHDRTLRLLDAFTAATRDLKTFEEVVSCGQRTIGEALGASRVVYGESRDGGKSFLGVANWCVGCDDLHGKLPVTGFSSIISQKLREGIAIATDDVAEIADSHGGHEDLSRVQIAAMICQPIMKNGVLAAILGVHQKTYREWSSDEVEMVRSFSERLWSETERIKAEQELLVSETRLRRLLEAATVGVMVNDSEGRFTYANPPLLKMLGYTVEDIALGLVSWSTIQAPECLEFDNLAREELFATNTCEAYETMLVRKDGLRIHVYVGSALIPDEGGGGLLGAAFVTDLTELKQVEDQLRALNAELEERVDKRTAELQFANKEMEGFTYSVSHDLRSPLRSIVATSRILLEDVADKLTQEETQLLEQQAKSANKLGTLIDDLLKLSRLSRDQVLKTEFDLSALADKVSEELLSKELQKQCQIVIEPGLRGYGDVRHIQLLIVNLLENACKFSPNGGQVVLGQLDDVFFVSDKGIGFDMAYAEKLFVPFERLVRDVDFPGTGVGLANAQRIVQRHGGQIWARSSLGEGATFFFTLPA